jgi:hypothetical protein
MGASPCVYLATHSDRQCSYTHPPHLITPPDHPSQTDPGLILESEDGLDHRFSAKGFYGTGIYGAEKASYSDSGYAFKCGTISGQSNCKKILLVKMALGNFKNYGKDIDRELRLPPMLPQSKDRFDSVTGGPHSGSIMHIVYTNEAVYPQYVVTYKP